MEGFFEGICDRCEKNTLVRNTKDPYLYEVYNERKKVTLCEDCYDNRAMDI